MRKFFLFIVLFACSCGRTAYDVSDFGVKAGAGTDNSEAVLEALKSMAELSGGRSFKVNFPKGEYHFYPDNADERTFFISNHDQSNPKRVGICLDSLKDVIIDGNGSVFVFHGRMLPLALVGCDGCVLKNFSIDFAVPHISQAEIMANDTLTGTVDFRFEPYVHFRAENGRLSVEGEGWELYPSSCIAFEHETGRIVYNTGDVFLGCDSVEKVSDDMARFRGWLHPELVPGTVVAMRSWHRPAPGIFLNRCRNTVVRNVTVHYAEGMGLLAQLCENVTLNGFSVAPDREKGRYFSTQADATHFSGCKGVISSRNGLYDGMMDDAINVHGTYLSIVERCGDSSVVARYMHSQSYGFAWGMKGDSVSFIRPDTMDEFPERLVISEIVPMDGERNRFSDGVTAFRITFGRSLPAYVDAGIGMENLAWTPKVIFENNTVRNNRARGALFSTPSEVVVRNNLFDHTSGSAILLCGDCNGWFESGACRNVRITGNRFVDALTSMYQFTEAVISICPEIPDIDSQEKYFHSGIVIENNVFDTFDAPVLFARSVKGLVFRGNVIETNEDYPPFHRNREQVTLERVSDEVL